MGAIIYLGQDIKNAMWDEINDECTLEYDNDFTNHKKHKLLQSSTHGFLSSCTYLPRSHIVRNNCNIVKVRALYFNTEVTLNIITPHPSLSVIKHYLHETYEVLYDKIKKLMNLFCMDVVRHIMCDMILLEQCYYYAHIIPKFDVVYKGDTWEDEERGMVRNLFSNRWDIEAMTDELHKMRATIFTNILRNHLKNEMISRKHFFNLK